MNRSKVSTFTQSDGSHMCIWRWLQYLPQNYTRRYTKNITDKSEGNCKKGSRSPQAGKENETGMRCKENKQEANNKAAE